MSKPEILSALELLPAAVRVKALTQILSNILEVAYADPCGIDGEGIEGICEVTWRDYKALTTRMSRES